MLLNQKYELKIVTVFKLSKSFLLNITFLYNW